MNIISITLLLLQSCHPIASQSAFSPFSILGSFFNPPPQQTRTRLERRHRPPGHNKGHLPQQQQLFRTGHHPGATSVAGHEFSASQQVPHIARFNEAVLSLSAPSRPSPGPPPSPSQRPPAPPLPQPAALVQPRHKVQRITAPSNFSFTTNFLSSAVTTQSVRDNFDDIQETTTVTSEGLPTTDLEDITTTNYPDTEEQENLHIIYPAENFISTGGGDSNEIDQNDAAVTEATDYQSTILSDDDTHFIIDTTASDFQLQTEYSEIQTTEYNSYREENTDPIVSPRSVELDESERRIEDSFYRQLTSLKTSSSRFNFNPFYSQEEFTYNQDPIVINHDTTNTNEIFEPQFSIKPRGRHIERRIDTGDEVHKTGKSVDFDKILSERLSAAHHPNEAIKLVNTIEYTATDYKGSDNDPVSSSYRSGVVGGSDVTHISHNMTHDSLATLVDCGAGTEAGFCSMTTSYPLDTVSNMVTGCDQVLSAWRPLITDDIDTLGDNSPSVIASHQDQDRPWSWRVYAYKKKQVCNSELYFMRPGFARDTTGTWHVIVQTRGLEQKVAVDMCHDPELPCPGLADCGKKSRCVQRYNYQMLLSLPAELHTDQVQCPTIRSYRFPSGCVCHAEVTGADHHNEHSDSSHHHSQ